MSVHLVLVHGRSQQHKDGAQLKRDWIDSLKRGLARRGLALPIPDSAVHFPYYGQALYDLWTNVRPEDVAEVVVRGPSGNAQQEQFMAAVLEEVRRERRISDDEVLDAAGLNTIPRGPLNWKWVQGILTAIDTHVPGASGLSLSLATNDVYQYLHNHALAGHIREGVARAIPAGEPVVVVAHSLGTVVAYDLLRDAGGAQGWNVPLFVTLGSPLGVTAIKDAMKKPLGFPACAGAWFNAMDPDDVVALYPLDGAHFGIEPAIVNKTDVDNPTPNQHGISGYLEDAEVAQRIHDALAAAQRPGAARTASVPGAQPVRGAGGPP
jgi:hypothetical protein